LRAVVIVTATATLLFIIAISVSLFESCLLVWAATAVFFLAASFPTIGVFFSYEVSIATLLDFVTAATLLDGVWAEAFLLQGVKQFTCHHVNLLGRKFYLTKYLHCCQLGWFLFFPVLLDCEG